MSVEKIYSQPILHALDSLKESLKKEESESLFEEQRIPITKEELKKFVTSINDFLQVSNTHIKFEFHEKLNEYYVTIVDNQTQEVVREIPSKKWLDIYSAMTEFVGLIVDKKI